MADQKDTEKIVAPPLGELAQPEDPTELRRPSAQAAPYTSLMSPTDSVLQAKGGIQNLKIYKELLRDDQVSAAWSQRRLALTSCATVVEPGADDAQSKAAAEALQAELDGMLWDDITDKALYAVFYGWGVAEVIWKPSTEPGRSVSFDRVVVRERGRFRFGYKGELFLWESTAGFVEMPERKFWVTSTGADNHDEPYGLGLAHQLYWPVFFKRNDIKYWLIFLEKFGMPTTMAKLPPGAAVGDDPDSKALRSKAIAMLKQIATDAGVVVPENVVVELLEAARSGAADYQSLHDAMNAAISKIIVGQTMTTDNGSSKSQAEVHAGVAEKIVQADSDLLCGSFNSGPVKWWSEWNFPGAVPPRVYRQTEPPEDLAETATTDQAIAALGFEPDEEYVREKYGPHWKKKQATAVAPGAFGSGMAGPGKGDPTQFAEGEAAALAALRAANRGDQAAIEDAARAFAEQWPTIMGRRVGEILKAADFSENPAILRQRLTEILSEPPPPETMQKLARGSLFARMLGAFRADRAA